MNESRLPKLSDRFRWLYSEMFRILDRPERCAPVPRGAGRAPIDTGLTMLRGARVAVPRERGGGGVAGRPGALETQRGGAAGRKGAVVALVADGHVLAALA